MQYITFNLQDYGSPSTGINDSIIVINLILNNSKKITITINNRVLSVSDSSLKSNFTLDVVSSDGKTIRIGWNASSIELYGFDKTYDQQFITVEWRIISISDKYGNVFDNSNIQGIIYFLEIDALPPPPDIVREIITAGIAFAIFLGVGVMVAFAYEKFRYIG